MVNKKSKSAVPDDDVVSDDFSDLDDDDLNIQDDGVDEEEEEGESENDDDEKVNILRSKENEEDDEEGNESEDHIDLIGTPDIDTTDTVSEVIIVPTSERITKPFLNKYEKTRVLATRSKHLSLGAKPLIKIENATATTFLSSFEIAKQELKEGMIPYIIRRRMPDGRYEQWKVSELQDIYT